MTSSSLSFFLVRSFVTQSIQTWARLLVISKEKKRLQGKTTTQGKRKRCVVAHAGARDRMVGWSCMPKPVTVWFGGDEAGTISHWVVVFFVVRMCWGTRLLMVYWAVRAVANNCQVVLRHREYTQVYTAVGGGVGSGRLSYTPRIRPPRVLVDAGAGAYDRWASWWRFMQAKTHGRRLVVGHWLRAYVRTAASRGCG